LVCDAGGFLIPDKIQPDFLQQCIQIGSGTDGIAHNSRP